MNAFNIGLSGLRTFSDAIQSTSTNIANASTTGYKASEYLFVDQFFRELKPAGINVNADPGVRREYYVQGAVRQTSSPLDMAIQGEGMFRMSKRPDGADGQILYSRNGQFSVDAQGYIVNANGLYLTGYQPDASGTSIRSSEIDALRVPASRLPGKATTAVELSMNLDGRLPVIDPTLGPVDPENPRTYSASTAVQIFDASGIGRTVGMFWKRIADNVGVDGLVSSSYELYLGAQGVLPSPVQPLATIDFENGRLKQVLPLLGGSLGSGFALDYTFPQTYNGDPNGPTVPNAGQVVRFDLAGLTDFGSPVLVGKVSADGNASAVLAALKVDETGRILGEYSNGVSVVAGQVVLATFPAPNGLEPASPTAFAETSTSGSPLLGSPAAGVFGAIRSASVEESSIDMAAQLVDLMIRQRNYQANAQTIRAVEEMLTTTIQLTR
jgi:flagellar hook protein FlgE